MLGEMVGEFKGKITGRRVLPLHEMDPKIEVSVERKGRLLGVEAMEMVTFWSIRKPGGVLYGEGQGALMSNEGEMGVYHATGVGKSGGRGTSTMLRGVLYPHSRSPKWVSLNGVALVYEYESDENGNTHVKLWEWK
ncbi:MAG: hypothetical protein LUO88_04660 [Methanoregulaceae archaeon]|nr:hypothetical protein [Methanoregulaceae archaeon]